MLFVNQSLASWKTANASHFKSLWISKLQNRKLPLGFNWSELESSTPYCIVVKLDAILTFHKVNDTCATWSTWLSQAASYYVLCLLRQHGGYVTTVIQTVSSQHYLSRWIFCTDININTQTINSIQLNTCKNLANKAVPPPALTPPTFYFEFWFTGSSIFSFGFTEAARSSEVHRLHSVLLLLMKASRQQTEIFIAF